MSYDLEKFKGVFVAFYSAYNDKGEVDKDRVKKLARYYTSTNIKGLYVGGSSGEGVLQSEEERKLVLEAVVEEVKGELTIIAHIGANSTDESVRLAKHAEQLGVDAISSIPCVYYRLSPVAVENHWQKMIDSTELPFIIYHIPQTTGFNLPINLLEKMAKQDKVIGIKCSSESTFELQQFKYIGEKASKNGFLVFNGPDEQFLAGRSIGADSGIGGTYGVMPELFVELDKLIKNNNVKKAQELQNDINEIIKDLLSTGSLYGAAKYILSLRGIETGDPRSPFLPIKGVELEDKVKSIEEKIQDANAKYVNR